MAQDVSYLEVDSDPVLVQYDGAGAACGPLAGKCERGPAGRCRRVASWPQEAFLGPRTRGGPVMRPFLSRLAAVLSLGACALSQSAPLPHYDHVVVVIMSIHS